MIEIITACIISLSIISDIDIKYFMNGNRITNYSECNLYFESNENIKTNILDSTSYNLYESSDSIRIVGRFLDWEVQTKWFKSDVIINSPISITYQDSIHEDDLPKGTKTDIKYYYKLNITVGNNFNCDYYLNKRTFFKHYNNIIVSKEQYLETGINSLNKGYCITALDNFNNAIAMDSLYSEAYYYRGKTYVKGAYADIYEPAVNDYKKCIELDPNQNFWEAYYYLALTQALNDSSYIKYYDEALKHNPRNIEIIWWRSFAKSWWRDYDGAMKDLNLILEIDPHNVKALIGRSSYYRDENPDLALNDLKLARKLDKNNPEVYFSLGVLYRELNKNGKECNYCKYFKKAMKLGYDGYNSIMRECGIESSQ